MWLVFWGQPSDAENKDALEIFLMVKYSLFLYTQAFHFLFKMYKNINA